MEYLNFRRIVLFAMGALILTVGVHQTALLYGASPVVAAFAAGVATFVLAVAVAAFAVGVAPFAVATVATVAAFTFTTFIFFLVVVVAFAAAFAIPAATDYRLKYWWMVLVFGIEGSAIITALTISGTAGLGVIVGLVGVGLLGSLWAIAPYLHLAAKKLGG